MANRTELEAIIKTIQMTPEQKEAFDVYMADHINEWKDEIQKKAYDEVTTMVTKDYNEKAKKFQAKLKGALTEELTEELSEKLTESINEEKETEYSEKLDEAVSTLNEFYQGRFEAFCQEAYQEIEKTLLESQEASPEVAAFRQVVSTASPFVDGKDEKTIEVLEAQDRVIKDLQEQLEKVLKERAIVECVAMVENEDLKEHMKDFLSTCRTEKEVMSKFRQGLEFINGAESIHEGIDLDEDELEEINEDEEFDYGDDDEDEDEEELSENFFNDDDLEDSLEKEDEEEDFFESDLTEDEDEEDNDVETLEEDYFDDGIKTEAHSENEEEGLNEGVADSVAMKRIKHLADLDNA